VKAPNSVLSSYGTTVFEVMSRLAIEHDAINLGQGFPDTDGPADIVEAAAAALIQGPNQYPPMLGLPALRQAVAAHAERFYGLEVDWQSEVMVTSGATEALADCHMALIEPGDEVVLIEPLYDCYLPIVRRAGAIAKTVRVEPPDWALPRAALEAAFSDRTKLLLLNNPMNPTAKVFTRAELDFIAGLLQRHDAYAVCDEVYEHIVFDRREHIPLMTLPGLRERTIRIGSAGKTFSLTGWKVGYVTAGWHRSPRRTSSSPSPRRPTCSRRWPPASASRTATSTSTSAATSRSTRASRRCRSAPSTSPARSTTSCASASAKKTTCSMRRSSVWRKRFGDEAQFLMHAHGQTAHDPHRPKDDDEQHEGREQDQIQIFALPFAQIDAHEEPQMDHDLHDCEDADDGHGQARAHAPE
jgi:hypothetical protein